MTPRFAAVFVLLSSLLLGGLHVTAQTPAQAARGAIVQQLHAGNPQAALSLAQTALQAAPHDCALLSLQAIALSSLGQPKPSLSSFRSALVSCPEYLPALEGAAQLQLAAGSPEAVPLLQHILTLQPANLAAHAMLASALRAQKRCAEALPHFVASQSLFPARPDLAQSYGACLTDTGDLHAALPVYQQLLSSAPNDSVRYDVALLQWRTGDAATALETLAPLLTGTHQVPALGLASRIHEQRGETPEAVALLRQAIVQSPDQLENYLEFASLAFNHTSFQVGIDMLNLGLQRLPNSPPLLVARGVLEVQLSQSEAASADFHLAHRLDPTLSFATDAVGILESQHHQTSDSLALFQAQAHLHGDDPLLQYLLAEQLTQSSQGNETGQLQAAIAAARRAVALDPHYLAAHDLLARLYVRTNQLQLAIAASEAALALDPNDQEALYQQLMARRRSGQTASLKELSERLSQARRENELRQQRTDRYGLQLEATQAPER